MVKPTNNKILYAAPVIKKVNNNRVEIRRGVKLTNEVDNTKKTPVKVITYRFTNANKKRMNVSDMNKLANQIIKLEQKRLRDNYSFRYNATIQELDGPYSSSSTHSNLYKDDDVNFNIETEIFSMVTSPEDGQEVFKTNYKDTKQLYIHIFLDYLGGDGGDNDNGYCFWKLIKNINPIHAGNYKGFLTSTSNKYGFDVNGTITKNDLEFIEKQFNISLYVKGDIYYESKIEKSIAKFNLILQGNHWTLDKEEIPKIKSEIIKLDGFEFGGYVYIDGKIRNKTIEDKNKKLKKLNSKVIEQITKQKPADVINNKKQSFINYIKQYEELKKITSKKTNSGKDFNIDLLKFSDVNNCIRHYINVNNKNISFEPIQGYEYDIMEASKWGHYSMPLTIRNSPDELLNKALEYYKKKEITNNELNNYTGKEYYHYDVVSCFSYILSARDLGITFINSPQLRIPLSAGKLKNKPIQYFYDDLKNQKLAYGFYKCKINISNKFKYRKFIRSTNTWYTNIDLYLIQDIINYENEIIENAIELIDEENNFMSANQNKDESITSRSIILSYVNEMIKYKQENPDNLLVKSLLARLHSALIQYEKRYEIHSEDKMISNDVFIYDSFKSTEQVIEVKQESEDEPEISVIIDRTNPFKSQFARLKCWLYSYQRAFMWNALKPYLKTHTIVQFLADGFYSDKPIEEFDKNPKELGKIVRK